MKRKTVLKKIVANITMGNDSAYLEGQEYANERIDYGAFISQCRSCFLMSYHAWVHLRWRLRRVSARSARRMSCCWVDLDLCTVVYLFLVSYGRSKPDQISMVIPSFLQVRLYAHLHDTFLISKKQDCADQNPLIRALAIRTMSYIPLPLVTEAMTDPLRHALKDRDPYVRKTAAICVAKVYTADPRRTERAGFVEMLRDLMLDANATVVANAVAALVEISERHDGVAFRVNFTVANKLLTALQESSEYVSFLFSDTR